MTSNTILRRSAADRDALPAVRILISSERILMRYGLALIRHLGTAAENCGLSLSLLPPVPDPDFVAAVLARPDAALLKSFATHKESPFLRPDRCILTCRHVTPVLPVSSHCCSHSRRITLRRPIARCIRRGTPRSLPRRAFCTCAFEQRRTFATSAMVRISAEFSMFSSHSVSRRRRGS